MFTSSVIINKFENKIIINIKKILIFIL
jgi:hypothetical protein